jgi:hypothetical protein
MVIKNLKILNMLISSWESRATLILSNHAASMSHPI